MENLLGALFLITLVIGANNQASAKQMQVQQQSHGRRIMLPAWPTPIQGNCTIKDLGISAKQVTANTFRSIKEKGYDYNSSYEEGLSLSFGCQTSATDRNNRLHILGSGNCSIKIEENNYTLYVGGKVIKNAFNLNPNLIGNKLLLALPKCVR